ncbi:MAG: ABC transporter permease [Pirellulales bacterium]
MIHYIVRRLLIGVMTLVMITFFIYGLIRAMPGSPLLVQMAQLDPSREMNAEDLKRMEKAFGLDKPWYQAYGVWVGNLVRMDLGQSLSRKQPVTRLIRERIGPTLMLSITSLLLAYLLSIPLGLWFTVRSGHLDERIGSTVLYMLYSFPAFVAALFMQIFLAVKLGWFPLFGMVSDNHQTLSALGKTWDIFIHSVLPVTCYTYTSLAFLSRFVRSNMMEVIRQDYIRTARAKGVAPHNVIMHHAFRNTLIPLVTLIGLELPTLLSGSIVLEQIFSWPGMGRLFFESISERDYPTIMGLTLMFSLLTLAGQLLADLFYSIVDPRVSLS